MPIDSATFKEIMSCWATGVTVVTCQSEQGPRGMTASAFASVSLNPPLVLVCVDRRNRTHRLIEERRVFAVHLLREGMDELSSRCAGFLGAEGHLLEDLPWRTAATGAPILDQALAWMDCTLWEAYDGGDHTIFVGEIQAGAANEGRPLLWYDRRYRHADATFAKDPPRRTSAAASE